jgi:hypothetical protein
MDSSGLGVRQDISHSYGLGLILDFHSSLTGRAEHGLVPVHLQAYRIYRRKIKRLYNKISR